MKVMMLADINSAHTRKWAQALAAKGIEIGLFSLSAAKSNWHEKVPGVQLFYAPEKKSSNGIIKIIALAPQLRSVLNHFNADILHAHYASSYGMLAALSGAPRIVVSAWGSDVMDFPKRSPLHRAILKYNLRKADAVMATSTTLKDLLALYSDKEVSVVPFGIDLQDFSAADNREDKGLVIGTVKSLEHIYGIDLLIRAFAKVSKKCQVPLQLLIAGGGSREREYRSMVNELGIADQTIFTGRVEYSEVPALHRNIDIFVNVSRNESFGVSVLEASASAKPVIVSRVGGLPEVVQDEKTGILVEPENVEALCSALNRLIGDADLRKSMGREGRAFVEGRYDLARNTEATIVIYESLIKQKP